MKLTAIASSVRYLLSTMSSVINLGHASALVALTLVYPRSEEARKDCEHLCELTKLTLVATHD